MLTRTEEKWLNYIEQRARYNVKGFQISKCVNEKHYKN